MYSKTYKVFLSDKQIIGQISRILYYLLFIGVAEIIVGK